MVRMAAFKIGRKHIIDVPLSKWLWAKRVFEKAGYIVAGAEIPVRA
jgi:hypothetical protein